MGILFGPVNEFLLADLYLVEIRRQRDAATREITPDRAAGGTDW
jgi:hypothetical protein